jgi:hypothetical protein
LLYHVSYVISHAAYRFYALPKLGWFKCNEGQLQWVTLASMHSGAVEVNNSSIPAAWLGPARKQLASAQRTALEWAVPHAELVAALGKKEPTSLYSQPVYSAGAAWKLDLRLSEAAPGGKRDVGVFLHPSSYSHGATLVAPLHCAMTCGFTISRALPGQSQPKIIYGVDVVTVLLHRGWGRTSVFTVASPSDLEPHLVDGCLRLQATVKAL